MSNPVPFDNKYLNIDLDEHSDKHSVNDSDGDPTIYVSERNTCRTYRCDVCIEEITIKNCTRHILTLKHLKNARLSHRNKFVDEASKESVEDTNDDIEQNIDRRFP